MIELNMTDEMIEWYESNVIYTIKLWEKCREDYGLKPMNFYPNVAQKFIVAFAHDAHADHMTYHDAAFRLANRVQSGEFNHDPDSE